MKIKFNSWVVLFLVALIVCTFSCRKTDFITEEKENNKALTDKFFDLPVNTNPLVKRIAENMKIQNDKNEFIANFIKTEGYAIWDKVIIQASNRQIIARGSNAKIGRAHV